LDFKQALEDIFVLSCVIYEVRDYAYSTANEMQIFNVGDTPFMQCMVTLLQDVAYKLLQVPGRLSLHPNAASDHAQWGSVIF
jgi:hypothetical protein